MDIKKAWSDQLAGVIANGLPNKPTGTPGFDGFGTGWAEKPYIFMSVRADGKAYIKAEVETSAPEMIRDMIQWRLAKKSADSYGAPEAGSSTLDAPTKILSVTLNSPISDDNDYVLVGGHDQNGDGQLSQSEVSVFPKCNNKLPASLGGGVHPQPFVFKIVSKPKYEESRGGALGITNVASTFSAAGWSNAGDLLAKFATSANPAFDSPSAGYESLDRLGSDNEGVKRGMSHPVGVLFQPVAERGQAIRAYYASQTLFATDFLRSRAFQIELTAFLNGKAELLKTLATPDPGNSRSFGMSGDLNFRNDITLSSPRADFNMLFGMGRCKYELTIAVDFEEQGNVVAVTDVRVSGRAVDLYDFDYDDDLLGRGFVKKAARVQSGYNTAGSGGRVITTELDFDEESVPAFGWQVSK